MKNRQGQASLFLMVGYMKGHVDGGPDLQGFKAWMYRY